MWVWVSMGERVGGLWRVDDFDFGFGFVRGLACVSATMRLDAIIVTPMVVGLLSTILLDRHVTTVNGFSRSGSSGPTAAATSRSARSKGCRVHLQRRSLRHYHSQSRSFLSTNIKRHQRKYISTRLPMRLFARSSNDEGDYVDVVVEEKTADPLNDEENTSVSVTKERRETFNTNSIYHTFSL